MKSLLVLALAFIYTLSIAQVRRYNGDFIEDGIIIFKLSSSLKSSQENFFFSNTAHIFIEHEPKKMFSRAFDPELNRIYKIEVPDSSKFESTLRWLKSLDEIEYAEPKYIPMPFHVPNDTRVTSQPYLNKINVFEAWDYSMSDSTIIIAIVDNGFDLLHTELTTQVAYNYNDIINGIDDDNDGYIDNFRGWDFGDGDNSPHSTSLVHGTRVTGLACARTNNETGMAGVGYNSKFIPIKVANEFGYYTAAYEGIVYAVNSGAEIINCSWGGPTFQKFGEDVINFALRNNKIVVAAAGNSNNNIYYYPASFDGVISVAGTVNNDEKWSPNNSQTEAGSTYNNRVSISAPAANLLSLDANNGYTTIYGGTSSASPMVAGSLALLKHRFPNYSNEQLLLQLQASADNIDTIPYNLPYAGLLGAGRLNVGNAMIEQYSGITISEVELTNGKSGILQSGDTVQVWGAVQNILQPDSNIVLVLQTGSAFLRIVNGVIHIDRLDSGTKLNKQLLFSFIIDESAPFDFNNRLKVSIRTQNQRTFQYLDFGCNSSATNFCWMNVDAWASANGRIGEHKRGEFLLKYNNENTITEGGIILLTDNGEIASSISNYNHFTPLTLLSSVETDSLKFVEVNTKDNLNYGYEIESDIGFDKNLEFNHLMFNYFVKKTTGIPREGAVLGVYFDWSIAHYLSNKVEYISEQNYHAVYSTISGKPCLGIKGLNSTFNGFYAIDAQYGNFNIEDGFSRDEQENCLTSINHETPNIFSGSNVSTIIWQSLDDIANNQVDSSSFIVFFAPDLDSLHRIAAELNKPLEPIQTAVARTPNVNRTTCDVENKTLRVSATKAGRAILYSVQGLKLMELEVPAGISSYNLSAYPASFYILKFSDYEAFRFILK